VTESPASGKPSREFPVLPVMIEVPKGSRNKYEYDKDRGKIRFDRLLFSPVHYPTDYGFIEGTLARDGDALDALVLVWEPTFPGCLIEARPVGLFRMADEKGPDEKVLCVPIHDPHWAEITRLDEVHPHLLREIEHFFTIYKDLEMKEVQVEGWDSQEAAEEVILDSRRRYVESREGSEGPESADEEWTTPVDEE
jgi:inorganic pyrophosphatase